MFKTNNQAGTTTLLIAAGVLLLIGIQGTSLVRVSGGSNTAEFERRLRQERFIEAAAQESATNPERAKGMIEGGVILDPSVAPELHLAITWNNLLREALTEAARPCTVSARPYSVSAPVKFTIETPEGLIAVIPKPFGEPAGESDLKELARHGGTGEAMGGLIVGNSEATAFLRLLLAAGTWPLPIEVVTWAGREDHQRLVAAIQRMRSTVAPPGEMMSLFHRDGAGHGGCEEAVST
ncbi:hypothetical protein [Micromonospora zingiberis]|uniref:hypothetical protein n=1 Tax=Micromonospora zingiberis TaxID=2053011 RepID=UPI001040A270|nr:hypothetical protein [Micromonospora zingiberis]